MENITNGSSYSDPRLHTLHYIRSRSSFLFVVILAIASTYTQFCTSPQLHGSLMSHAHLLEANIRVNHLKSVEIVQGLLLLASWSDIPSTLCRDKTWVYISHAIALTVELRLETPLPHSVVSDYMYTPANHQLLIRNAHRTCMFTFIHDRVSSAAFKALTIVKLIARAWQWSLDAILSCLTLGCTPRHRWRSGVEVR
jgi:hypothetical protein